MKKTPLFFIVFGLMACQSNTPNYTEPVYLDDAEFVCASDTDTDAPVQMVKFSTPHGNDLRLETARHIIQIDGAPNQNYGYQVWVGNKDYTDEPDLIIQDGQAGILVDQD